MSASIRSLRLAQRAPQILSRGTAATRITPLAHRQTRLLNTETAPVLYSAHAKVVGARTGHVQGDDLVVDLTMAKALGGAGDKGKTNPEELFAAGYGACFQSAMNASAASLGVTMPKKPEDSVVDATVHLVGDMKKLDMGLRVNLKVRVKGLSDEEVHKVVERAEEVCPYSRATRGNVATTIEVVGFEDGGNAGGEAKGGKKGDGKAGEKKKGGSDKMSGVEPKGHSDYQ
ncbi:organic hydroperoxide resistance protein [Colletotrichum filicis]|nr:organic hydroperoxide resistance protein [Colletotrichum filicis]